MKTRAAVLAAAVAAVACAAPCRAASLAESAGTATSLEQAQIACRKAGASGSAMGLPSASEYFDLIRESDFARAKEAEVPLKRGDQASSLYPIWTEDGLVTMQDGTGMDMTRIDPTDLAAQIAAAESAMEHAGDSAKTAEGKARLDEGRANVDALKAALKKGFPVYCVARAGS